jgi:hypothetical protein
MLRDKAHGAEILDVRKATGYSALTKRKFLAHCNTIWSRFGFDCVNSHCFRIGGVPPDIVRILGCWNSDAFHSYTHEAEVVTPLHAELLAPLSLHHT